MKKSEAFPTRFLSAADLNGKAVIVTIERTPRELSEQRRTAPSPSAADEMEDEIPF